MMGIVKLDSLDLWFSEIAIDHCVAYSIKVFRSTPKSASYRQHATPPRDSKKSSRPNVSYYSQDYHDTPKTELVSLQ